MSRNILICQISLCIFTNYFMKSGVEVKCSISIFEKCGNITLTLYENWRSLIFIRTIENLTFCYEKNLWIIVSTQI